MCVCAREEVGREGREGEREREREYLDLVMKGVRYAVLLIMKLHFSSILERTLL